MSDVAIRVQGLAKRYRIGERQPYKALRDILTEAARAPARTVRAFTTRPRLADPLTSHWALRDITLEVKRGEVLGVIGRNGAGKSTLLKILSRITEPTEGVVDVWGRLGSLLEVGTGFHPELTGRENIYLNGAILGMKRREIDRKFDEIVAFSGVERYLDTPVKRYSSGMYTRLAFAVAAHLEPDILLVDEVLSVGDAAFQKKCLGKMDEVARQGHTILFVSHNMPAITRLCQRAVLLEQGQIRADGPAHRIASMYLRADLGTAAARTWSDPERAPGNEVVRLRGVRARTCSGEVREDLDIRRPIALEMDFDVLQPGYVLVPNFHVYNEDGICVFVAAERDMTWHRRQRPVGRYVSTAWIPGNFLAEGGLVVGAAVSTMMPVIVHAFEPDAISFHVVDSLDGDSARGDFAGTHPGVVRPLLKWETRFEPIEPASAPELASVLP